ncbi:F-type H+-transporting ATPase subunit delta [Salinibacter ruber]|uniref:ATP synthase F1 subunit delta n=1 Tax=Salinibacter ruber TaxID=146919 RepID=UPI002169C23B|nr:ATP synthase F1 subunit delta [Salinibacter ruber]MCS3629053.1 F-type H+-transporting ATPase subunit delta [Salinibacter ruber]MCS3643631.1 F-type H+-transporting ATPase subunit delta [Salinibacter ruber]MCS3684916.1 F-type H+-transporting ATPase subunit delta [Salinibacter ruber]MCS3853655.1 F-type H+-transporting ATPase subunit delta [Salinibacter ruber]MCS4145962.1 F-type H+-transporting ATPase subunit delta [Salinibacter ruber]
MSQRTVTRRYAAALYEEANANGVLEAVDEDVRMLLESLDSNRPLVRVFESPVIPQDKKDSIVRELLGDRVEDLTVRFLRLLIRKDRETMTEAILDQYQTLRDEQRGIVDAEVTVARPLADETRTALVGVLEEKTGKEIRLHLHEDADLIGGLVVRIGDRVFDASVRSQLGALHDRLREATLSENALDDEA